MMSQLQNPKGVMDICATVFTQFLFPYKRILDYLQCVPLLHLAKLDDS